MAVLGTTFSQPHSTVHTHTVCPPSAPWPRARPSRVGFRTKSIGSLWQREYTHHLFPFRGEFEVKLEGVRGEIEVKFESIHQFLSMTPPSSPPSSPPPPSPPQMRDCAASPCTDSYWLNGDGARERHVRQTEKHSDRLKKWMSTARRTLDCPPHTGHLTARTRVTTDRTWLRLVGPCTVSGQVHRRRVGLSRVSRVSRVRVWCVSRLTCA